MKSAARRVPARHARHFKSRSETYLIPYIYNTCSSGTTSARFADAGIEAPKTWDELLAACDALKRGGLTRPIAAEGNERATRPST